MELITTLIGDTEAGIWRAYTARKFHDWYISVTPKFSDKERRFISSATSCDILRHIIFKFLLYNGTSILWKANIVP